MAENGANVFTAVAPIALAVLHQRPNAESPQWWRVASVPRPDSHANDNAHRDTKPTPTTRRRQSRRRRRVGGAASIRGQPFFLVGRLVGS